MTRRALILAAGFCAAVFSAGEAASQTTLKYGHYNAESHPVHKASVQFAANVEKRTGGKVKVQVFPNNALGAPPEILEQTRNGVIDIAIPTSGQLDKYDKAFAALMIPFAFADIEHARRTMDGPMRKWLEPKAQKMGLEIVGVWEYGFRHLTNSKRPIQKPEDVKGLKIRVPPEFHLQALFESLGAVVTQIAWPEVYMALAQNVVDGQENPLNAIYYAKFYEVQKQVALTRHAYSCLIPIVSAKTWAKLNAEQKQILKEEAKRSGDWVRKALNDEETDLIGKFEKAGLKVTRPDPKPFRAAIASANEKIYKRYGEDNVKTFLKFVEDARKK